MRLRPLQLVFAGTGIVFLISIVTVAFLRSEQKTLAPASQVAVDLREEQTEADRLSDQDGSELQLRDFRRVGAKDGRKLWEVSAKDASYFAGEGITQVNDVSVVFHREDNSKLYLKSKAARLQLATEGFGKADFEGDIKVDVDDRISVRTDAATYDEVAREVLAPGDVAITGQGYFIEGTGMTMDVDEESLLIRNNVRSRFESGASVPKVR